MASEAFTLSEKDIKDPIQIAFLNGYMGAYEDISCALDMYRENVLSQIPSESMRKAADEICSAFAEYARQYVHDQREKAVEEMLAGLAFSGLTENGR